MSDIQGNRPDESIPATSPNVESAPPVAPVAPIVPQAGAIAQAPPVPPGWPGAGASAAVSPQPTYAAAPAYGSTSPQGYGDTAQQSPYAGSAFGASHAQPYLNQTQATLPLTGSMPAAPEANTRKHEKSGVGVGGVVGLIVAATLVGGAAGLGGAYAGVNLWGNHATAPVAGPSTVTVNNPDSVNPTTAIAAKALPSVVTIDVSGDGSGGTGSGVILNEDGYVATNTHVVTLDGATGDATIRVTTSDGRVFDAKIVGTDPTYDLAVIKLEDAEGLTPIEFADSSKLNVGDQTVAIGAPLGLPNTVTTGIVSTLNRSIQIASSAAPDSSDTPESDSPDEGDENGQNGPFQFDIPGQDQQTTPTASISIAVVQTDAAINPGNSGGALVDGDGKLIGINVAIATAGGTSTGQAGSIGVGFSIPSNIVKRVTTELMEDGTATHGLLGASVRPAASVEDSTISGAYIEKIVGGGAADKAGLRAEDIVTMFNGVPITDSIDLTAQVRAAAAGSDATLTYVRDGKSATADVTLGELEQ